jgi:sugar O-acyltransferase (sialic acid O-acetyltransferase NeuD family)
MKPVIIVGNSITAQVLYSLIKEDDRYKVECFAADEKFISSNKFLNLKIIDINEISKLYDMSEVKIILAVGYNNINQDREALFKRLLGLGFSIETYIHKNASVHADRIGAGCIILPGAVVDPCCKIGSNSVIWSNVVCAHHSDVGNNCWLATGAILSGESTIKKNTFLGVSSIILNKVIVAEYNIIGAGAMIMKNTKPNEVYLSKAGEKIPFNSKEYAKVYGY